MIVIDRGTSRVIQMSDSKKRIKNPSSNKKLDKKVKAEEFFSRAYYSVNLVEKIKFYSAAINFNCNYIDAYFNRGSAYKDLKDYDLAIRDFTKVIELNSNDEDAYNNRAVTYYAKEEYSKAIQDYNKLLKLNTLNANAYFNRGLTYRKLNMSEKALDDFSTAIELNPKDWEAYYNRGIIHYMNRNYEKAIYENAYNNRGAVFYAMQEYEKAIDDYVKVIKLNPHNRDVYCNIALICKEKSKIKGFKNYTEDPKLVL